MADRFAWPAPAPSEPTTPTENPQRGFEDPSRFNLFMAAGVVFYSAAAGGCGRACHKNVMGYCLEFSDHEESGGSNLWPTDSLGRRQ
ncbi:MAG: hypothetical protein PUK86_11935, partial [bacterium]|nr:hypothetical protein [bacterium]